MATIPRRALITGITGQDGSYLAELLLERGYEVIGMVRRSSTVSFERIAHLQDRITFVSGDLLDEVSMIEVLREHRPAEVYNLAAQSFVQTSFGQPVFTGEVTALGVTRLLDAIRLVDPDIRFYQASSSEMFGKVVEVPQRETTPFHPRSPYGVAKVYGHWITVNYRESYGLHASSGILFNHESVPGNTPVVVRRHGIIDIVPIGEIVPHREDPSKGRRYSSDGGDYEVWDGTAWVPCLARTAHYHRGDAVTVAGRGASITSTPDHVIFTVPTEDGEGETDLAEVPAQEVRPGDRLVLARDPLPTSATRVTEDEAWLLGMLTADGHVRTDGATRVTNSDPSLLTEAGEAWVRATGGWYRKSEGAPSAFVDRRRVPIVELRGNRAYGRMIRSQLYCEDGSKRVPARILNADVDARSAYLRGYNAGDGLKAGNGTDEFKSFRTTSPTLAAGLVWLARTTLGRRVAAYEQPGASGGGTSWLLNLSSGAAGRRGAHLRKPLDEVRSTERSTFEGWMFDLATPSERFAAGVGFATIHNSPRRGLEFVTRKISSAVAQIKLGQADELRLGNLEAQRDWGFAGDYVDAMWRMLQQDEPGDFVVATGETHSVREFCELAFDHVGLDWEDFVVIDDRFFRPAEVDLLVGDPARAHEVLDWQPATRFEDLVRMMVDADIALLSGKLRELS